MGTALVLFQILISVKNYILNLYFDWGSTYTVLKTPGQLPGCVHLTAKLLLGSMVLGTTMLAVGQVLLGVQLGTFWI